MTFPTDVNPSVTQADQAADEPPLELCVWDALWLARIPATGRRSRAQAPAPATVLVLSGSEAA